MDNQIVDLLLTDGRMPLPDIGNRVELSRTAVKTGPPPWKNAGLSDRIKSLDYHRWDDLSGEHRDGSGMICKDRTSFGVRARNVKASGNNHGSGCDSDVFRGNYVQGLLLLGKALRKNKALVFGNDAVSLDGKLHFFRELMDLSSGKYLEGTVMDWNHDGKQDWQDYLIIQNVVNQKKNKTSAGSGCLTVFVIVLGITTIVSCFFR